MFNKTISKILLFIAVTSVISFAQQNEEFQLTGNLSFDSKIASSNYSHVQINVVPPADEKKSAFLAGLMSLVVPGSGEIYAESYLKAGIFLAVEATLITVGLIYDKKGDDQTVEFQAYAEENWHVLDYADYVINTFYNGVDPGIINSRDPSLRPDQQVNWDVLNANEKGSHTLPRYQSQQYYELIGKYHQFTAGWNDFRTGQQDIRELTPKLTYYAGIHADADEYYNVAAKAVVGLYINHFLSAFDAVWTTVNYNKTIAMNMRVESMQYAGKFEYVPTLNMKFSF